jgi:hypothetical protein
VRILLTSKEESNILRSLKDETDELLRMIGERLFHRKDNSVKKEFLKR